MLFGGEDQIFAALPQYAEFFSGTRIQIATKKIDIKITKENKNLGSNNEFWQLKCSKTPASNMKTSSRNLIGFS